jgi:23S rRNA (cytidine1920-2'-O)/16S rRNA (cytidine1409-2'-O)-methyltransferase
MQRLDQALVERGLCVSREQSKRLILAGQVRINGQLARKPSDSAKTTDKLEVASPERFVSRGGFKLEKALLYFGVSVSGAMAIDLGASTGGFTDCLLQHGAKRVYAVDVGRGQLAWKLRQDQRVVVMEKTNARDLTVSCFPQDFSPVELIVADCSFISLRKILPAAVALLQRSGKIIALIKPQFEAGKRDADKGAGVIRDPAVHERVIQELRSFVIAELGLNWVGVTESPLLGPAGNKEFLALIENAG